MEFGTKLVLAACRFGTPIVYIGILCFLYFTDQENALAPNLHWETWMFPSFNLLERSF